MILMILLLLLVAVVLALYFIPVRTEGLRPDPHPSASYTESLQRIEARGLLREPGLAEHGREVFLTHGHPTERAIVFYHGFTNCPRQYELLAKKFFEQGFNVYVPRIPHHGIDDLFTKAVGRLTIQELMEVCDSSVDIAQGLGREVTVLGVSMGGVMAAWCAQFRTEIHQAVLVVPSFGWYFLPGIISPLINLAYFLPNLFLWWDPVKRDKRPAPYSMYHRFSTRGMGHIMRLGLSVLRDAAREAPKAGRIVFITNDMDIAVDEQNIKTLYKRWKKHGARPEWFRFSKTLQMEHDIIDPLHPYARVDIVYDKILELVTEDDRDAS